LKGFDLTLSKVSRMCYLVDFAIREVLAVDSQGWVCPDEASFKMIFREILFSENEVEISWEIGWFGWLICGDSGCLGTYMGVFRF